MSTILKYLFVLFSITVLSSSLYAQDLIVTSEGDSLNCKITKIKAENIYFTFNYKGEVRSTIIPVSKVVGYQRDYFQTPEVPAWRVVGNSIYPHFRVAINVGWSYRIAKIADDVPSDYKQYLKGLKSGLNYGIDLSYYFSEQFGFGIQYCNNWSKNETNITATFPDGSVIDGIMSDNISINYIGPYFSMRLLDAKQKNSFLMDLGMGYTGYRDDAVIISAFSMKGNCLGFNMSIGYDIGISKKFALGFKLAYLSGSLRQIEVFDGVQTETIQLDADSYESLSRIDLSIGFRFIK